jgi:hypothetical protein
VFTETLCSNQHGSVRRDPARLGSGRHGTARHGKAR